MGASVFIGHCAENVAAPTWWLCRARWPRRIRTRGGTCSAYSRGCARRTPGRVDALIQMASPLWNARQDDDHEPHHVDIQGSESRSDVCNRRIAEQHRQQRPVGCGAATPPKRRKRCLVPAFATDGRSGHNIAPRSPANVRLARLSNTFVKSCIACHSMALAWRISTTARARCRCCVAPNVTCISRC